MANYTTSNDLLIWCEKTIEETGPSSLKTAAEHLLVELKEAQKKRDDYHKKACEIADQRDHYKMARDSYKMLVVDLMKALEPFAKFVFGPSWRGHEQVQAEGDSIVNCGWDERKMTGINVMWSDFEKARKIWTELKDKL